MNSEKILFAMGNINDELIENALKPRRRYKIPGAIAACLCLLLVLSLFHTHEEPEAMGGAPGIEVGGQNYIISPYIAISEDIPEGFSYGGKGEINGTEHVYYIGRNFPYWVYVYQEVLTDGQVDENGTLISAEPHYAYVRYVRADIRGKDLIMVNGSLYASVWSHNTDTDIPARTETLPEGYEYYGETAFCGYDTVPRNDLESNTGQAQIFVSESQPDRVLVSTSWYTATKEENGETKHYGYNVYIPFE